MAHLIVRATLPETGKHADYELSAKDISEYVGYANTGNCRDIWLYRRVPQVPESERGEYDLATPAYVLLSLQEAAKAVASTKETT